MAHVYKGLAVETPSTPPRPPSAPALLTLMLSAAANAGLAVYQWRELFSIRNGGTAACSINETVNCAAVWSSPFASKLHDWLGMPVAGLGLVWALTAVVLTGLLAQRATSGKPFDAPQGAVKLTALVGVAAIITFASASFAARALCLTCLGTYTLVAIYAFAAFVLLPKPALPTQTLATSAAWAVMVAAPIFLVLLWPGQRTPKNPQVGIEATSDASDTALTGYLEGMPQQEKLMTAYARQQWLAAPQPQLENTTPRALLGSPDAPVKVVEFTDILCSHCRQLELTLEELRRVLPQGRLSVEARYFPLDGECNPGVGKVWGDGIRCLAAKAQICLEGTPALWPVKHALFEQQANLTKELILETATTQSGLTREALQRCIAEAQTQQKLDADIAYAMKFNITGTPLVVVNGKSAPPSGAFLLALAISRGDASSPFFLSLPAPPTP